MNGAELVAFNTLARYSGSVVVNFLDGEGDLVQATVTTPVGQRYYAQRIQHDDAREVEWFNPRTIDNVARFLIDRAVDDDREGEVDSVVATNGVVAPSIKVERFAVFSIEPEYRHLGETIYVAREKADRWPPSA